MRHQLSVASGSFPGADGGYTVIRHVCPTGEFLCGVGKDKGSPVMPCSVKFVLDVLCQCVDAPAHIDGFYDQEYIIRRQHGEEPGKHRLTEKAGSTSGYHRAGKV